MIQQTSETLQTKDNSLISSKNTSTMDPLELPSKGTLENTNTFNENLSEDLGKTSLPLDLNSVDINNSGSPKFTGEDTVVSNKLSSMTPITPELPPDFNFSDNNNTIISDELSSKSTQNNSNFPENNIMTSRPSESTQTGGGFFDFITKYFTISDSKSSNETKGNFIAHKNDYLKWKEQVLPFLDNQDLNIVISHGKYIKRNVLNNNASSNEFTANNLDGFLLEYNITDGKVRQVNLLDNDLKPTVIKNDSPNQITFKPTIGNMKKTEIVWEKITQNSKLPPEMIKKYSKCFLK